MKDERADLVEQHRKYYVELITALLLYVAIHSNYSRRIHQYFTCKSVRVCIYS